MSFEQIINHLDSFARENTFLSIVLLAIIANLLTGLIKKIFRQIFLYTLNRIKTSGKKLSECSYKNTAYLKKHYIEEIKLVEELKKSKPKIIGKLLEDMYSNFVFIIVFIVLYFLVKLFDSPYFFYGLFGASSTMLFKSVYLIYYNTRLFEKAQNFDSYKQKTEKRIEKIQQLLNKSH